MAKISIDVNLVDCPQILEAGPLAGWLYVCGLCYCSRHPEAKGIIPLKMVYRLTYTEEPLEPATRLTRVGLWESTPDGYRTLKPKE